MIRNTFRFATHSWGLTLGFRLGMIGILLGWSVMGKGQDLKSVEPPAEEGLPVLIAPDEKKTEKPQAEVTPATPPKSEPERKKPAATPKPEKKKESEVIPLPMITPDPVEPAEVEPVKPKAERPVTKSEDSEKSESEPAAETEQWTMLITSGPSRSAGTPPQKELVTFDLDPETNQVVGGPSVQPLGHDEAVAEAEKRQPAAKPGVSPAQYRAVYDSIPYSRAEYLANPSYRHDATMEFLFGELRPTVVHKQDKPVRVYNQPQVLTEGPPPAPHPIPWNWYSPAYGGYGPASYFGWRYPYWTPDSTYRRYQTQYGPLFNRYYRPLGY